GARAHGVHRRGPEADRAQRDVLPGHRRRARPAGLLVQGRPSRLRARRRSADARLSELRWQRDVPQPRQHPGQSERGPALRRLRASQARARERHGHTARGGPAARRVRRRPARGPRARDADLPDLPQLAQPLATASSGAHKERPFVVPLLAGDRARYVGEPVAVVVAETAALAADARDAVSVEYAPLPPLVGAAAARGSATRVHADWPDNVALSVGGAVGEIDLTRPGLTVVRERFRHQRLAAMPIECRGALAQYDAETGVLTVWASIQSPYSQRDVIARVLGLPAERVRVIVPDVGGQAEDPRDDVALAV